MNQRLHFPSLLGWTRTYFDTRHPPFPFLHVPSILQRLEHLAKDDIGAISTLDQTNIKAIISISLADRRQVNNIGKPVPKRLVFASFGEALRSVQAVVRRPATVHALQAAVCRPTFSGIAIAAQCRFQSWAD